MMRTAWAARETQAKEALATAKRELTALDKQTDALLARIVETTNDAVLRAYEAKIAELDKTRARLQEKACQSLPPKDRIDEFIEHALTFLANPWKIWETGQTTLQRTVLKLAFAERQTYTRNQSYRTPKTTLSFKALEGILEKRENMVRSRRLELPRELPHSDLNAARLPIPPRPHVLGRALIAKAARVVKGGRWVFWCAGLATRQHRPCSDDPSL